jgi:hypothetical protein
MLIREYADKTAERTGCEATSSVINEQRHALPIKIIAGRQVSDVHRNAARTSCTFTSGRPASVCYNWKQRVCFTDAEALIEVVRWRDGPATVSLRGNGSRMESRVHRDGEHSRARGRTEYSARVWGEVRCGRIGQVSVCRASSWDSGGVGGVVDTVPREKTSRIRPSARCYHGVARY